MRSCCRLEYLGGFCLGPVRFLHRASVGHSPSRDRKRWQLPPLYLPSVLSPPRSTDSWGIIGYFKASRSRARPSSIPYDAPISKTTERKSVVEGQRDSVRVNIRGHPLINKTKKQTTRKQQTIIYIK